LARIAGGARAPRTGEGTQGTGTSTLSGAASMTIRYYNIRALTFLVFLVAVALAATV
jgi:hypothetical protein